MEQIFLPLSGRNVAITLFRPRECRKKVFLLNSATGVKQHFYFTFAQFLQENGITVITYDYTGIGLSATQHLRKTPASMRSWGTEDFKAVTAYMSVHFGEFTWYCLGHSVGALIIGLNDDSRKFAEFFFIGTQDAYIGNLRLRVALTAMLGFGIALPVLTSVLGYFPASVFGLGADLPKGVARDWRRLILTKMSTRILYDRRSHNNSTALRQKVLFVHAEDDHWVTHKGMLKLLQNIYPNLQVKFSELKTSESPEKHIGHVNFFRSYNRNLWTIILDKL